MLAVVLMSSLSCTPVILGDELRSDKAYNTSPEVSTADLATLVGGNTEFALDLYQQLKDDKDNLFYSPYSISLALAMTYAGAGGVTRQEMRDVLHFELDDAALHAAFNQLSLDLAGRSQAVEGKDDDGFKLNIANAIWGQQGFGFPDSFLDTLAQNYNAGMRIVNFSTATEEARQFINQWVSDETEDKIEELIAEGDLDPATVLTLTNAIYFKARWFAPFAAENTHDAEFTLLDGSTVIVPMMIQDMAFDYTEGSDYQAVELMYKDGGYSYSMVVLLPAGGGSSSSSKAHWTKPGWMR
jgi:serpin B